MGWVVDGAPPLGEGSTSESFAASDTRARRARHPHCQGVGQVLRTWPLSCESGGPVLSTATPARVRVPRASASRKAYGRESLTPHRPLLSVAPSVAPPHSGRHCCTAPPTPSRVQRHQGPPCPAPQQRACKASSSSEHAEQVAPAASKRAAASLQSKQSIQNVKSMQSVEAERGDGNRHGVMTGMGRDVCALTSEVLCEADPGRIET